MSAGVGVPNAAAATGVAEVQTEAGPLDSAGNQLVQQVVQVAEAGAQATLAQLMSEAVQELRMIRIGIEALLDGEYDLRDLVRGDAHNDPDDPIG